MNFIKSIAERFRKNSGQPEKIPSSYFKKSLRSNREEKEVPLAHFNAQPSEKVQKILSVMPDDTRKMRLEYVKGQSLGEIKDSLSGREKLEVTKQIAHAVAELHLRFGITHGDISQGNIIVDRSDGKITARLIDYEFSDHIVRDDLRNPVKNDFNAMLITIDRMSKNLAEEKKLWKHFKEQYEKKADEML